MACKRWLLAFISLILTTHFAFVTSQYEANFCSDNGNYTSESLYRANLNTVLQSLSSNIGNSGFYKASIAEANAIALCRGDIQLDSCRGCVNIVAAEILRRCPNQFQAIMWSEFCMVRYSNEPIFGILANEPGTVFSAVANVKSRDQFYKVLGMLIDDLRAEAANGSGLRKAAAGNRTAPANQTIYAMVQCTPDLSPENCTSCLVQAAGIIPRCCNDTPGVRVYRPSCTLRYESRLFYNITRLQETLEPSSLPSSPPSSPPTAGNTDDNRTRNIIIIVVSIVVFLIVAFCIGIFGVKRSMKQKAKGEPEIDEDGDGISTVESIQYDFDKIRAATDDFSDANKLGQGGFGAVYKGKLQNGREIAVKRLSRNSCQGDLEFKNEVLLVAKLQHRNLVRLLGFSLKGIERLLIYEFVQNGSLDHFIFDRIKSLNLDWDRRYKIVGGVAKGLLYLHEDSRFRIIHRDLKAGNVLLDEEMNPKISDFGLAKLVVPDATQESTSKIVGTYGYMAPEYAFHGHFSIKSDVYSFGVLVLEIVTGQKKTCFQNEENSGDDHLLSYAWRSWREGTSANMIDPALMATSGGAQQDMLRCIHIALLCVQENPDDRPTMASVVVMLNSFSVTLPLPSEPGFYIPSSFPEAPLSQAQEYNSKQMKPIRSSKSLLAHPVYSSGNDSSISHLYPR